jgi:hypothetical protein
MRLDIGMGWARANVMTAGLILILHVRGLGFEYRTGFRGRMDFGLGVRILYHDPP